MASSTANLSSSSRLRSSRLTYNTYTVSPADPAVLPSDDTPLSVILYLPVDATVTTTELPCHCCTVEPV
eukprot:38312-Eustigmatos_ZCMA.PRE.1